MFEFSILLEACNPEKKHWRSYFVASGKDLLGDWVVEVSYGRIGARGHRKTKVCADQEAAREEVLKCLERRVNAPKRLGVPYKVKSIACPENSAPSFWCPPELLQANILQNKQQLI
ncbi:WGR domain-containing protein [Methylomagnum ishizawai]|uniref:WGR domain-containing protein n=1 Tax=Methylomagnum ishizawai TaxID=1760988 RepID=A0A1Y6DER3_9GAMM|nr:WGR domain-containing protein [Methylomagnum ishizawai]SMF97905.1 WGR domain-containing protein [Methylomagnum ishizawai]